MSLDSFAAFPINAFKILPASTALFLTKDKIDSLNVDQINSMVNSDNFQYYPDSVKSMVNGIIKSDTLTLQITNSVSSMSKKYNNFLNMYFAILAIILFI
jgi:hypothetical protein